MKEKTMSKILADGQCHYAFYVETQRGKGESVQNALKGWKDEVRGAKGFGVGSIDDLCETVRAIPGVGSIVPSGPRSALPLALRMACGLTGRKGGFACHIGKGIMSEGIRREFEAWNIDFLPRKELEGDMPAAFLVFDPSEHSGHETVTLFPLSRTGYKHRSHFEPQEIAQADGVLLNRVNDGVLDVARQAKAAGKPNCLRIHGYTRHVSFDDYRPLLPLVDHLVLDVGHNALRDTANGLGLNLPRGWLETGTFRVEFLREMADALDAIAGKSLLHVIHINGRNTLYLLGKAGQASYSFEPRVSPGVLCDLKATARVHGAVMAAALVNQLGFELDATTFQPKSEEGLVQLAAWVYRAAHHGILNVPWKWPDAFFDSAHLQTRVQA
jgi:sugar/nucleoside kinase (ribokinase family)